MDQVTQAADTIRSKNVRIGLTLIVLFLCCNLQPLQHLNILYKLNSNSEMDYNIASM